VARKLDVPLVLLAVSVDSVPGTKDYFALIEYNVAALAGALSAPGQQVR
jgi:ABC-type Zn uptake system ZnuABC Zn-binding protein ZnuA